MYELRLEQVWGIADDIGFLVAANQFLLLVSRHHRKAAPGRDRGLPCYSEFAFAPTLRGGGSVPLSFGGGEGLRAK